jgi:porphobilinogen synthase
MIFPDSPFPIQRPRRLRKNKNIIRLVRETHITIDDLIYPIFVEDGENIKRPIPSMPGIYRYSPDTVLEEIKEAYDLGIKAIILFGIPAHKDEIGSASWNDEGVVQRTIRKIKSEIPDMVVIADVCFCEYTSHGHCGVLINGEVDNDLTLENLKKQAISLARSGADILAPSGMMDGMVKAIREALDQEGFKNVAIMSYAVKYASAFYGPFRDAAESAPAFGDRSGYQMDPANKREAFKEAYLDILEGADFIMVKPALAYLDIIHMLRETFPVPIVAYNVSGEYTMVKTASKMGFLDEKKIIWEILTSIKRAGADLIITYFAKEVARMLKEGEI